MYTAVPHKQMSSIPTNKLNKLVVELKNYDVWPNCNINLILLVRKYSETHTRKARPNYV